MDDRFTMQEEIQKDLTLERGAIIYLFHSYMGWVIIGIDGSLIMTRIALMSQMQHIHVCDLPTIPYHTTLY